MRRGHYDPKSSYKKYITYHQNPWTISQKTKKNNYENFPSIFFFISYALCTLKNNIQNMLLNIILIKIVNLFFGREFSNYNFVVFICYARNWNETYHLEKRGRFHFILKIPQFSVLTTLQHIFGWQLFPRKKIRQEF